MSLHVYQQALQSTSPLPVLHQSASPNHSQEETVSCKSFHKPPESIIKNYCKMDNNIIIKRIVNLYYTTHRQQSHRASRMWYGE